jgi:hypothetical protein
MALTDDESFWGQFSSGESDRFRADPDMVRKVELRNESRGEGRGKGRDGVRVTVISTRGQIKVFTAPKALLASVIEKLYDAESEASFGE